MVFSSFSRMRHRIAAEAGANPPSSRTASRRRPDLPRNCPNFPLVSPASDQGIARMRRLLPALLLAIVAGAAALPGTAAARMLGDPSVPFSADRTLTVGDRSFTGKLYATPGSQRHEQQIAGIDQVIILHGEDARGWLLLPKLNSYVEFWFTPAAAELNADDLLSAKLGEETVNG